MTKIIKKLDGGLVLVYNDYTGDYYIMHYHEPTLTLYNKIASGKNKRKLLKWYKDNFRAT